MQRYLFQQIVGIGKTRLLVQPTACTVLQLCISRCVADVQKLYLNDFLKSFGSKNFQIDVKKLMTTAPAAILVLLFSRLVLLFKNNIPAICWCPSEPEVLVNTEGLALFCSQAFPNLRIIFRKCTFSIWSWISIPKVVTETHSTGYAFPRTSQTLWFLVDTQTRRVIFSNNTLVVSETLLAYNTPHMSRFQGYFFPSLLLYCRISIPATRWSSLVLEVLLDAEKLVSRYTVLLLRRFQICEWFSETTRFACSDDFVRQTFQ